MWFFWNRKPKINYNGWQHTATRVVWCGGELPRFIARNHSDEYGPSASSLRHARNFFLSVLPEEKMEFDAALEGLGKTSTLAEQRSAEIRHLLAKRRVEFAEAVVAHVDAHLLARETMEMLVDEALPKMETAIVEACRAQRKEAYVSLSRNVPGDLSYFMMRILGEYFPEFGSINIPSWERFHIHGNVITFNWM